jgi:hypothetical protein
MTSRPLWPWIVATVIAMPALYVASWGPMTGLRYSGRLSPRTAKVCEHVYAPVDVIIRASPAANVALTWYLDFFHAGFDEDGVDEPIVPALP